MKLIVGLGNPGNNYKNNRHNVGFMALDAFATYLGSTASWQKSSRAKALYLKFKTNTETIELLKPQTLMNASGVAVAYATQKHKIPLTNLFVLHDDLDIRLGEYKIQKGTGPKDHKGLISIEKFIAKDFWRVRIGVDNRAPDNRIPGEAYVLQNFNQNELQTLQKVLDNLIVDLFNYVQLKKL